jgi:four helix bundle protein
MEIVVAIFNITKKFPREEMYGIISQMRRAAVSVPSNVSEGYNRFSTKEYRQFLSISLGSCGELETQVEASCALNFITEEERNQMMDKIQHEARMLRNLIKKLVQ